MLEPPRPPRSRAAAQRKARYRTRQRDGRRCGRYEYGPELLDTLIRLQWLAVDAADDQAAVDAAVSALLADMASG